MFNNKKIASLRFDMQMLQNEMDVILHSGNDQPANEEPEQPMYRPGHQISENNGWFTTYSRNKDEDITLVDAIDAIADHLGIEIVCKEKKSCVKAIKLKKRIKK